MTHAFSSTLLRLTFALNTTTPLLPLQLRFQRFHFRENVSVFCTASFALSLGRKPLKNSLYRRQAEGETTSRLRNVSRSDGRFAAEYPSRDLHSLNRPRSIFTFTYENNALSLERRTMDKSYRFLVHFLFE